MGQLASCSCERRAMEHKWSELLQPATCVVLVFVPVDCIFYRSLYKLVPGTFVTPGVYELLRGSVVHVRGGVVVLVFIHSHINMNEVALVRV
jgi:hypothetical protein